MKSDQMHPDAELIEKLGNTAEVARMFGIKNPSVSNWKKKGIPPGPFDQLKKRYPREVKAHERKHRIERKRMTTLVA